ncbi:hypothetical protein [Paenibacillus eucommiae]|uniref:DUF4309 domain-containing protein n=1 Tax=Paenibacillus eucommiae TaxID=1355755 RepID=A0ABS4IWN8_9BACL|nr:hypothetical protein [Paenibacillus eucommiae]MBP1991495.1 hypothetical protein [Paenibacillus eucommiae]
MKKGILLICLLFLLCSCGVQKQESSPLDYVDKVASTDLSGEMARSGAESGAGLESEPERESRGLSLGAAEQLLVDSKGEPMEKVTIIDNLINWVYADTSFFTLMDHVVVTYGFNIESKMSTSKGIKVGDSIQEAKAKYGQAFYSRKQANSQMIGYIDKKGDTMIEFLFEKDVIMSIMVSQLEVFRKMAG